MAVKWAGLKGKRVQIQRAGKAELEHGTVLSVNDADVVVELDGRGVFCVAVADIESLKAEEAEKTGLLDKAKAVLGTAASEIRTFGVHEPAGSECDEKAGQKKDQD